MPAEDQPPPATRVEPTVVEPTAPGRLSRRARVWSGSRWVRPPVLALILGFFALPFLTVGCDTPGGFGRVSAGGSTSYRGFQLAFGLDPSRTPADHVLPPGQGVDDRLGVQPLAVVALLLVVAALIASILLARRGRSIQERRITSCALSAAALIATVVAVLVVRTRLIDQVADQLHGRVVPPERSPADYVAWGNGFSLTTIGLAVVALVDLSLALGTAARARGR